jgi:hypothetical protein
LHDIISYHIIYRWLLRLQERLGILKYALDGRLKAPEFKSGEEDIFPSLGRASQLVAYECVEYLEG